MFTQNNLQSESSAYLQQHTSNPVWWQTWNNSVLQYAKEQNKLLIISIGYSSCHWCHVMEHECFEDEEVATIMNQYFVSIKVDREERPDLDNIFMNALQTMGIQGGWPLNIVAFPNGEPFFGGTYFPKEKWISILKKIITIQQKDPTELVEISKNVTRRLQVLEDFSTVEKELLSEKQIQESIEIILQQVDRNWGGFSKAPKFPMPNAWKWIMLYAHINKDAEAENTWKVTLNRMMFGGIFDVVSGGFSRYSVDPYWKVPHFEKMLYDNAQLLSLYANAYKITKDNEYNLVIQKTVNWLQEEMYSQEFHYFYAAIDADSEGKEGSYYVWKTSELKTILAHRYDFFAKIFNVEQFGLWEQDKNILIQLESNQELAHKMQINLEDFLHQKSECLQLLKNHRNNLIKPLIDKKCVVSWNALLISGLCDCYQATSQEKYLLLAERIIAFIWENYTKHQTLPHCIYPNKKEQDQGFLEDYAFVIQACISLYESTFNKKYLEIAKQLTEETLQNFYHRKNKLFTQKSLNEDYLLTDYFPIYDSVEPSANAVMCENLFKLSRILSNSNYYDISKQMLAQIQDKIAQFPISFTHWFSVLSSIKQDFYEIVIMGNEANTKQKEINKHYFPNKITVGSIEEEYLKIMENRFIENETFLYLCKGNTCFLPETQVENLIYKVQKEQN